MKRLGVGPTIGLVLLGVFFAAALVSAAMMTSASAVDISAAGAISRIRSFRTVGT